MCKEGHFALYTGRSNHFFHKDSVYNFISFTIRLLFSSIGFWKNFECLIFLPSGLDFVVYRCVHMSGRTSKEKKFLISDPSQSCVWVMWTHAHTRLLCMRTCDPLIQNGCQETNKQKCVCKCLREAVKTPTPRERSERELVKFCSVEFLPEHLSLDIIGVFSSRNLQGDWGGKKDCYVLMIENNTKQCKINCWLCGFENQRMVM